MYNKEIEFVDMKYRYDIMIDEWDIKAKYNKDLKCYIASNEILPELSAISPDKIESMEKMCDKIVREIAVEYKMGYMDGQIIFIIEPPSLYKNNKCVGGEMIPTTSKKINNNVNN